MASSTEENYLKAIYKIAEREGGQVSTNAIAAELETSAASVSDMVRKLAEKKYVSYRKYRGVELTKKGAALATELVRVHRLWEVFLVQKLQFKWDEVHDLAEELEHVRSTLLVQKLDAYLGHPRFDPHGDPIPDKDGNYQHRPQELLHELPEQQPAVVVGVAEHSSTFLQYLERLGLTLGAQLVVQERMEFDHSLRLNVEGDEQVVSAEVGKNLFVKREKQKEKQQ